MAHTHVHGKHLPWCDVRECGPHALSVCRCRITVYALVSGIAFASFAVESIGALWSHSSSLWADGLHVVSDAVFYILAAWALNKQRNADTPTDTSALIANLSGAALVLAGLVSTVFGIVRLGSADIIHPDVMLVPAVIGLVANIVMLRLLRMVGAEHGSHHAHHAAVLHTVGDLLSSAVVCVVALVLLFLPHWGILVYSDPLCAIAIGVWLMWLAKDKFSAATHAH